MVLEFINGIYEFVFILIGLIGIAMGVDRALKEEEEENTILELSAAVSGGILLVLILIIGWNGAHATNYTLLFGLICSISLFARPFKEIPIAFIITSLVSLVIFYLVVSNIGNTEILSGLTLQLLVIGILILVGIIFIAGFIYEQALDAFLFVLGWGPVVTIFSAIIILQGLTLLLFGGAGILGALPG